ncbi:MAG: acyl carrier protein [Bryobacterales bacterium]|nr:acyl carrier protein [Bryobacterales bacterium]
MSENLYHRLRPLLADLFQLPADQISPASSPDTIESWDSMQHLNMVLALEQQFGIAFAPEEIEQLVNVELIADLLEEKLTLSGGPQ